MFKKLKKVFVPLFASVLVILILIYFGFTNLNAIGNLLKVKNLGVKTVEKIVDNNHNLWSEYKNQNFSFYFPMYLSSFNNISATELTEKDEIVANYFRHSDSEDGDNYSGRSYWIILMQKDPYFETYRIDTKNWIVENKLNIQNRDCSTCSDYQELPIEEMTLGGKKAYSISGIDENSKIPRSQKIYFQTRDGIASIGFFSYSPGKELINDYHVFQEVVESLTFLK